MASGHTMDTFANLTDSDISHIGTDESAIAVTPYLVISHFSMTLAELPILSIDGLVVTPGVKGSGNNYEVVRVSDTQTVVFVKTPSSQVIKALEPMKIGMGVIGSTFVIE